MQPAAMTGISCLHDRRQQFRVVFERTFYT